MLRRNLRWFVFPSFAISLGKSTLDTSSKRKEALTASH